MAGVLTPLRAEDSRARRQRVQAQLRLVHLLEDGLGDEDVEVGRQLQRRAEALDEGHGAGEWARHPEPPLEPLQ